MHEWQFVHLLPSQVIRLERPFFLIFVLKADNEARPLSLLDNLDHKERSEVSKREFAITYSAKPGNKKV